MNDQSSLLRAAAEYFASIFAIGFVLGTARVVWGAQALGETTFIVIEVLIMLSASFLLARWLLRRHRIDDAGGALAMGGVAFVLLMVAELTLTSLLAPSDPAAAMRDWLRSLLVPPGLFGFAGQIAFGLMPVALIRLNRS